VNAGGWSHDGYAVAVHRWISIRLCLVAAIGALPACGPSATDGGFDSANPAAKMYAIEQAARNGDRSATRALIEQLDSDDPAVRMLAISTLQRLTGQTYGYRHYDDRLARRQAIAQWVTAYESGETDAAIVPMKSHSAAPPGGLSDSAPPAAQFTDHASQG
jgi:hypothetical protein